MSGAAAASKMAGLPPAITRRSSSEPERKTFYFYSSVLVWVWRVCGSDAEIATL